MESDKQFTDLGAVGDRERSQSPGHETSPPPAYTEHAAFPHSPAVKKDGRGEEDFINPPPPYYPSSDMVITSPHAVEPSCITTQPQRQRHAQPSQYQSNGQMIDSTVWVHTAPSQGGCCQFTDDGCNICICCCAWNNCCNGCSDCGDCKCDCGDCDCGGCDCGGCDCSGCP